jgi:hypothetical protein
LILKYTVNHEKDFASPYFKPSYFYSSLEMFNPSLEVITLEMVDNTRLHFWGQISPFWGIFFVFRSKCFNPGKVYFPFMGKNIFHFGEIYPFWVQNFQLYEKFTLFLWQILPLRLLLLAKVEKFT